MSFPSLPVSLPLRCDDKSYAVDIKYDTTVEEIRSKIASKMKIDKE